MPAKFITFVDVFQAASPTETFIGLFVCRIGNDWGHWWQQSTRDEGKVSAEAHWERSASLYQGICDLSHVSIPWHYFEQGDQAVFPPMYDLPFQMFCPDHQNWFPGCHWQAIGNSSKAVIMIFGLNLLIKTIANSNDFLFHQKKW